MLLLQVVASQRPEYAQQDQQTICADAAQQARALPITLLEQRHRQWFVLCGTHRIQHPQVFCRRVFDVHELLMALQPQEVVRSLSTLVLLPRRRFSSHLSVWPRIQLGACRGVTPAMLIVDSTSFLLAPIWSLKSITSCCIVAEARAPPVFDFPNFRFACLHVKVLCCLQVAASLRHVATTLGAAILSTVHCVGDGAWRESAEAGPAAGHGLDARMIAGVGVAPRPALGSDWQSQVRV